MPESYMHVHVAASEPESAIGPALHRRRIVRADRGQRAGPPLDLHERVLPRAGLGELRGAAVEREDVRVAVDAHRVGIGGDAAIATSAAGGTGEARAQGAGRD